ncbi:dCMP deaminase [Streptosporangium canum]|uniref:dCMP deaminase n=1 Tax=Streptosporangium canum TaxID=324952 RepID=A0A1I3L6W1_9ACTN|nr:deaminase [Streptosporangium canum]SFI80266.1 dCMP deaminase [Streptosporangium canum]
MLDNYEEVVSFDGQNRFTIQARPGEAHGRPGWDEYFLGIASAVSQRGDCVRRRVGAVIARPDHRTAGTGYNGVPPGAPGCIERPCLRVSKAERGEEICPGYSDCRSVHAEANALLDANRDDCVGATLYCTDDPCQGCLKLIRGAGIARVVTPHKEMNP